MNVTSLEEMRLAQAARANSAEPETDVGTEVFIASPVREASQPSDDKMEQIRHLLIGDQLQTNSARLAAIEQQQKAFEAEVHHRLDLLSQRLDALSRDVLADRKSSFDELARAVHEFGNRIRGV